MIVMVAYSRRYDGQIVCMHMISRDRDHQTSYVSQIIPVEKICHVEKFQISVKNSNNLWSFIEIYVVFALNLCGENSLWRKYDKYEVWGPF